MLTIAKVIIEQAKADEESTLENLIFLLDTPGLTLCKALVAWQRTKVVVEPEGTPPDGVDRMQWLWKFCKYDGKTFSSSVGMKQSEATDVVRQLRDLRLIYPDGTVNDLARKLVGSRIRKEMAKFVKPAPST